MTLVVSTLPCRLLEWDTAFFGRKIGKIDRSDLNAQEMESAIEWALANQIECLYYCCSVDNDLSIRTAEHHQFNLIDVKVEMILRTDSSTDAYNKEIFVRPYRAGELVQLEAMDNEVFKQGRFYHDPGFTKDQATALYREWLRKSCEEHTETVFVAEYECRLAGFITFHKDSPSTGRIGIIGVCSQARRKGVGKSLITAMIKHYKNEGIKEIKVVTQGRNVAAQNLFQRQGFYLDSMSLWYHKWFKKHESSNPF